jgi:uncharacterized membrane protein YkvA (DUF1232 family)
MGKDFQNHKDMYAQSYSESDLKAKLRKAGIGKQILVKVYTLWEVLQSPHTPVYVKAGIIAVLGYFISPVDLVPDIIPGVGYLDDMAVMVTEIAAITKYITPAIKAEVARKL